MLKLEEGFDRADFALNVRLLKSKLNATLNFFITVMRTRSHLLRRLNPLDMQKKSI